MITFEKITIVDIDLEDDSRICGDKEGLTFDYGFFRDKQLKIPWNEVKQACIAYKNERMFT